MTYTTNHTLLQKLREGGEEADWQAFRDFYSPLIAMRGHDYHLDENEIKLLIQNVMLVICQENVLKNYDSTRGRFRDYLRTITSRQSARLLNQRTTGVEPVTDDMVDESTLNQNWEEEWQKFLYDKALEEMMATMDTKAYMAFELHAEQGRPAEEVAKLLGISTNQVYLAKSRGVVRLQKIIARLRQELGE